MLSGCVIVGESSHYVICEISKMLYATVYSYLASPPVIALVPAYAFEPTVSASLRLVAPIFNTSCRANVVALVVKPVVITMVCVARISDS